MKSTKKMPRKILLTLILLPFMISFFVFSGLFGGFYVAKILGRPNFILFPLILSLIGFLISLLMTWIIAKKVSV